MPSTSRHVLVFLCCLGASGCATVRTLDARRDGDPLVMTGTRLDVAAIEHPDKVEAHFRVAPPRYPALDLPFSFAADVILVPMLLPAIVANSFAGR